MRYLLDRCANARIRRPLREQGYDCWRWLGDPTAADKVIAAAGVAQDRVVISDDNGFLAWRRQQRSAYGYHVHLVGRKKAQPDLLRERIRELDEMIKACGPGSYIVEKDQPIQFEKGGRYNQQRGRQTKASNAKKAKRRR